MRFLSATRLVGDVDVSPYQGETGAIVWRREGVLFQRAFPRRAIMNTDDETPRDRGRRLRAEPTEEERKLGRRLRAKRSAGFKFRRLHRIGLYFADFCRVKQRLVIELDGSQHAEQEDEGKDAARTALLSERGYRVMRFWNEQVNREMDDVLEAIYPALTDS